MTARIAAFLVTLPESIREDDAKAIQDALGMIRGVAGVSALEGEPAIAIAQMRERLRLKRRLFDLIEGLDGDVS